MISCYESPSGVLLVKKIVFAVKNVGFTLVVVAL